MTTAASEIDITINVPVSPEEALTWFLEPEKLSQWWGGQLTTTGEVGADYHVAFDFIPATMLGTITEKTATTLSFTWAWSHDPDDVGTSVMVEATKTDDGTDLRVRHVGYKENDDRMESHKQGWDHFLPKLKASI